MVFSLQLLLYEFVLRILGLTGERIMPRETAW
jgi:hypothetical protein